MAKTEIQSNLVSKFLMDVAGVTITTFDPTLVVWDGQPYAGVAKRALSTVTGHAPFGHDLGFGGGDVHGWSRYLEEARPVAFRRDPA
jgi:hypothetical protein